MQNLGEILKKADKFVDEFKIMLSELKLQKISKTQYKQAVQALFEEVNQRITFKQLFEKSFSDTYYKLCILQRMLS